MKMRPEAPNQSAEASHRLRLPLGLCWAMNHA